VKIRFSIFHFLACILFLALVAGAVSSEISNRRQIRELQNSLADRREQLHSVEYGRAVYRAASLNPVLEDAPRAYRFLQHELAMSVLTHWQNEQIIDDAVGNPGYARSFVGKAVELLDCRNATEFVALAKSELWVYPDDQLHLEVAELVGESQAEFDRFLEQALAHE